MLEKICKKYSLPNVTAPVELCTDNAAMIAWMGWELINAEQEFDVRGQDVQGMKKIPLGSYVEGLINIKGQALRKVSSQFQSA
jgi:tRNA A37 threonylcarbamoyltransferase TsaD